ncbi:MAG: zinc-ribbon domain-containing protein, partial [Prevotella sp.]
CPECGHQISDKAPVCPSCGVEIAGNVIKCPYCGEVYLKG